MEPVCKPHMLSEYPLGYSHLTYETEDPISAVEAPGYFGPAAPVLRVRDIIEIWAGIGGAQPVLRRYVVTRADAGGMTVDIAPVEDLARRAVRRRSVIPDTYRAKPARAGAAAGAAGR